MVVSLYGFYATSNPATGDIIHAIPPAGVFFKLKYQGGNQRVFDDLYRKDFGYMFDANTGTFVNDGLTPPPFIFHCGNMVRRGNNGHHR